MSPNWNEGVHLTELLQALLEAVIPMLLTGLGGACGWLWKSHCKQEARDKAIEAGLPTSSARSSRSTTTGSVTCMSC